MSPREEEKTQVCDERQWAQRNGDSQTAKPIAKYFCVKSSMLQWPTHFWRLVISLFEEDGPKHTVTMHWTQDVQSCWIFFFDVFSFLFFFSSLSAVSSIIFTPFWVSMSLVNERSIKEQFKEKTYNCREKLYIVISWNTDGKLRCPLANAVFSCVFQQTDRYKIGETC